MGSAGIPVGGDKASIPGRQRKSWWQNKKRQKENEDSLMPPRPRGNRFKKVWLIKSKFQKRHGRKRAQWTGHFKKPSAVMA